MWLIGTFSLASSSTFAVTSRLAETEDHGEAGGSKRSFVLIGDKCNARGGKATRWERQIRQKEGRKGERGCGWSGHAYVSIQFLIWRIGIMAVVVGGVMPR